uniref:Latent transforming growth factor beta binding protein 4 n=1 Tax=Strix occidentalis caurina TaxID=311401 RepID=A0A8D0FCM4_STROC
MIFGSEFCRNGQCLNTVPGYKCFCRTGYFYDSSRLECVGKMASRSSGHPTAHGGTAVLLHPALSLLPTLQGQVWVTGFLKPPWGTREEVARAPKYEIHLDVCWQTVADYICQDLLHGEQTTYTECCCRLGEAWGQNCALCPHRSSGEWDSMGKHPPAEGLQAEECGILNGCENGRCVRVREGYTCDCFDGFQLDMTRMACVDINECEEVDGPEPLCRGGTCENTEGSYRCHCSPGYVALARPHRCVPQTAQSPVAA